MRYFTPFLIIPFAALVQSFGFAQDPPGIKWQQIQTDHYQIIFPEELSEEGNRVANTMEHVHQGISQSLEGKHRKIPILLSNRSVIPNGFVGQAPWMSEWYNIPLMVKEMGNTEWYRDLAVHEGRHMVQTNYMNRGVSRVLGLVFGEATQSLYTRFLVPGWYWEGDAVGIETAFTHSGRGRSAYFNRTARALILEGKQFNYRQALYGSFKEDYPGHYELGYYLTRHLKHEYGKDAWPEIIGGTMHWPFTLNPIFPFSRAMKKTTGSTLPQIYRETFFNLEKYWSQRLDQTEESPAEILSPQTKIKTNYLYPAMTPKGEVIALKTGLGDVPTLIKIVGGKETILTKLPSSVNLFGYHSNGRQAVWSAYDPDKRWTKLSWANIRLYDLETDQVRIITTKKRLFNPNISKDGQRITAITFSENRQCLLVILNAKTGAIIDQVEAPNGGLIMFPSWSKDGRKIVFTAQKYDGRAIYIYQPEKKQFETVKAESWMESFKPIFFRDFVIYESPLNGIDQLVAIHRTSQQEYQVTSRKFGASNAMITQDGRLLFNDYSSLGDAVALMDLSPNEWQKIPPGVKNPIQIPGGTNSASVYDDPIPNRVYEVVDYTPSANIFNFHSRYIFDDDLNPTLGVQSDNILGTMTFSGEMSYNQNEKTSTKRIKGTYKGYYPIFDFELSFGNRNVEFGPFTQKMENTNDTIQFKVNEKWRELTYDFGMTLQLKNQKKGITTQYAYSKVGTKYTRRSNTFYHFNFLKIPPNVRVTDSKKVSERDGTIIPVYIESGMISIDEKAPRDLGNPGWQIYGYLGGMPFGGLWQGQQSSLRFQHGMRGFGKHHFVSSLFQYERNKGDYVIPSKVPFPYGYKWHAFDSIWRVKIKYRMPLLYPDWSLPFGVSYLKRIQAGAFIDRATINDREAMLAIGAGITFETGGFFDIKFPLPITINYYYHPNTGKSGIRLDFE